VVLAGVLLEQPRRFRVGRRVGVRVAQQRLDGREHRGNVIDGGPVVLEDVQADTTVSVDVGVEEAAHKFDNGGLVGVVFREVHREFECATFPGCVIWSARRTATDRGWAEVEQPPCGVTSRGQRYVCGA